MPPVPWDDIDPGIVVALHALADHEIDTFSSCQGADHGGMPEILFHGTDHDGLHAVWLLENQGFHVQELSRHWDLDHGLPRQPFWRVALYTTEPFPSGRGTHRVAMGNDR